MPNLFRCTMRDAGRPIPKGAVVQVVTYGCSPSIAEIKEAAKLQLGVKSDDVTCSPCNWVIERVNP